MQYSELTELISRRRIQQDMTCCSGQSIKTLRGNLRTCVSMTLADINLLFIFWISGFSKIVLLTIETFPANYVIQSIFLSV